MNEMKRRILSKSKTCELVDELKKREGVKFLEVQGPEGKITIEAEDNQQSKPAYIVEGPQILIRVID